MNARVHPHSSQLRKMLNATQSITLICKNAPGDVLMVTAAVRDLKKVVPNLKIHVETRAPELWENNPHISTEVDPVSRRILINYKPYLQSAPRQSGHFVGAIHRFLEDTLRIRVPCTAVKGDIHMSKAELEAPSPIDGPYWICVCGGKTDFTTKWWTPAHMQAVVDHYAGKLQFVQIGSKGRNNIYPEHVHFKINGVINKIGETTPRELIKLVHHAEGVLCPVTFAMHLAAAVDMPNSKRLRPCVVIAGGRETPHWEAYPGHQFLHNVGQLSCCATGACWARRAQLWPDGQPWNKVQLCKQPVEVTPGLSIARCMDLITPERVIAAIDSYYKADISLPVLTRRFPLRAEATTDTSAYEPSP